MTFVKWFFAASAPRCLGGTPTFNGGTPTVSGAIYNTLRSSRLTQETPLFLSRIFGFTTLSLSLSFSLSDNHGLTNTNSCSIFLTNSLWLFIGPKGVRYLDEACSSGLKNEQMMSSSPSLSSVSMSESVSVSVPMPSLDLVSIWCSNGNIKGETWFESNLRKSQP